MKMEGKTVLVTGSTDGVGHYVASRLAAVRRKNAGPRPRPGAGEDADREG